MMNELHGMHLDDIRVILGCSLINSPLICNNLYSLFLYHNLTVEAKAIQ